MSTARKAALLDRAREKREAKKYDLSSVPPVGTMSIANFFKPRTGGPVAAPADEARDVAAVDETSRDSVSGALNTPMKESPQEVTPDTQKVGRKRLRQVDSSDDEDGGADERAAAESPAKCPAKAPAASPVKAASSKLAASFFLKKKTEAESEGKGAQPPAEEATASEATAAPAGDKRALATQPAVESSGRGSAKPPAKAESKAEAKAESKAKAEAKAEGKGSAKDAANEDDDGAESDAESEADADEESAAEVVRAAGGFCAEKEATWAKGAPVPYAHLAAAFEAIEATTKRLEIAAILTKARPCPASRAGAAATAAPRGGGVRLGPPPPPPPPTPSRTNWTRLLPPSVLSGHVSSRWGLAAASATRRVRSGTGRGGFLAR